MENYSVRYCCKLEEKQRKESSSLQIVHFTDFVEKRIKTKLMKLLIFQHSFSRCVEWQRMCVFLRRSIVIVTCI